jgi:hypothetical protein
VATNTHADPPALFRARLTIDETTAHMTAPAGQAEGLYAWFRGDGVRCRLLRGQGAAGLDVVDFGDPCPAEEHRIRRLFAVWCRAACVRTT